MKKTEYKNLHLNLSQYKSNFNIGRSFCTNFIWNIIQPVFSSFLPGSYWRVCILRLFGADIGKNVTIKPLVKIKFPWKLVVGDDSWIGESVWIDNLDFVYIGNNCCVSQGVYFCTGSHNHKVSSFDLITLPISIGSSSWICAKVSICLGVKIPEGSLVSFGKVITLNNNF